MNYEIISKNGNQSVVEVTIGVEKYKTLIVCSDEELNNAINSFIQTIENPIVPKD